MMMMRSILPVTAAQTSLLVASLLVSAADSFCWTAATFHLSTAQTVSRRYPGFASSLSHRTTTNIRRRSRLFAAAKAGTFFNPVPEDNNDNDKQDNDKQDDDGVETTTNKVETDIYEILRQRKSPSRASQPSTINGIPTQQASRGFGTSSNNNNNIKKSEPPPFIPIGRRSLNDVTKPEYDDQGYTLYADEQTGQKSRVFEALVEYPCDFTLKIVGRNEGTFVAEMVAVVAESCKVDIVAISHSVRVMGKWTSVTVQAPVSSAAMLYELYENVDRDPRVKFKF